MDKTKSPGEDGITSDTLYWAFSLLPKSTTALYNGCLRMACFPKQWKTAIIIAIIKPGKETSNDIAKYRPISLISTLAKVLEKSPYKQNHALHAFTQFTEPKPILIYAANQHSRRDYELKRLCTKEHGRGTICSAYKPRRKGSLSMPPGGLEYYSH